jgi:hypothetical protein
VRERPSARQGPGAGPGHAPVTIAARATAPSAFSGDGPPTRPGRWLDPRETCVGTVLALGGWTREENTVQGCLGIHPSRPVSKVTLPTRGGGERESRSPRDPVYARRMKRDCCGVRTLSAVTIMHTESSAQASIKSADRAWHGGAYGAARERLHMWLVEG